ncbi:hypothetical protein K7X08_006962 [Anisodus acutangulus]|uniref:Uncharacterized protein n=1 Tax=Anisodus acutangulus TaxID=402998 RepID=A0A9Q1LEW4_9SOLA|nr:hypothetical protein K7X08_006962 [Anisodus acutangulus]
MKFLDGRDNCFGGASTEQVVEEGDLSSGDVVEPVVKRGKQLHFYFKSGVVNQSSVELENEIDSPKSIVVADIRGIESTQGEFPLGECTRKEHDSLLSDALQSNPGTDVSEMQVESLVGDVRREEHDESINVATEMEKVSQQAAFCANGEYPIDEQTIVIYSDVIAEHLILVCNPFTNKTVVPESVARDTVAQGTPVESDNVNEGSVQFQCGKSSEENDDDFVDIMDITSSVVDMACDIGTPAATKTYKRRKMPELSNVNIRPPISSLKTRGQRARILNVVVGTPSSVWMMYSENNNLHIGVRKGKSYWNENYRRIFPFHYEKDEDDVRFFEKFINPQDLPLEIFKPTE